jgi:membrane protease YdiL (CAAX protease family)
MYYSNSKNLSYIGAFFVLIAFGFVGLLIGSFISIPVWLLMTGEKLTSMQKGMFNPANVNALRVVQVISTFFAFFVPAYITARMANRKPMKLLGYKSHFNYKQVFLVLVIMFVSVFLAGALGEINQKIPLAKPLMDYFKHLEDSYSDQVQAMAQIRTLADYIITLIIIAFLPALFEETFFRGAMQTYLYRSTRISWLSILITSIIFSLAHFSFYGFLGRVALGYVLGLIFYYTGNIWLNVLAHFFNNGLAVTQMYILTKQGKSIKDSMEETYPIWWGLAAAFVLVGLFMLFKKISEDVRKSYPDEAGNLPGRQSAELLQ